MQLDSAWIERLHALLELGRKAVALLAALLASALVIVTFNTIRLQLLTQRAEIEVSRLLGATDRYIRALSLAAGRAQGMLGGLVAWALLGAMVDALAGPVSRLAASYGTVFTAVARRAAGCDDTRHGRRARTAGALLSVNRHLKTAG